MKRFSFSSWWIVKILSLFILLISSWFYVSIFHEQLVNHEWLNIAGVTRIVIPDTFIYMSIVDHSNPYASIVVSGIKNSLGPSALWYLAGFNWYIVSFINFVILCLIVIYMEKLAKLYSLRTSVFQWSLLLFVFTPSTLYYSIGALKELPMMFLLLALFYHYQTKSYINSAIFASILVLFRYQLFVVLFLMVIFSVNPKKQFRRTIFLLFLLSAMYPLFSGLSILSNETTAHFRDMYSSSGTIGAVVENIRGHVYVVSTLAVIVRMFQTLLSPMIGFLGKLSFYEYDSLSIITVVSVSTLTAFIPFICIFFIKLIRVFRSGCKVPVEIQSLYSLLVIALILIGGFSFIHHRYIYPLFPLLLIASLIPKYRIDHGCRLIKPLTVGL